MYGRANDGMRGKRELKVDERNYETRNPQPSLMVARAHQAHPAVQAPGASDSEERHVRLQRHAMERNAGKDAVIIDSPFKEDFTPT